MAEKVKDIRMYTDGACSNNGTKYARAGWAIAEVVNGSCIFKMAHPGIHEDFPERTPTNNIAELSAIHEACKRIKISRREAPDAEFAVVVDSQWAMNIVTGNFRARKNLDIVAIVRKAYKEAGEPEFMWVRAHDVDTYNSMVDELAVEASRMGG
jgi:ribonuclease HI